MTSYPERLLTEDEVVLAELRPHWRVLLAPAFWLVLTTGAVIASFQVPDRPPWLVAATVALSLVFLLGLAVPPVVRRAFTLYVLTTERIVVRSGVVSRAGNEIPLESISNVSFSQRLGERFLGYGDVLIESAGESSRTRLRDVPDPEQFQSQVYGAREKRALHFSRGGPGTRDVAAQLESLARLRRDGDLTDEEYERQKQRLLEG